MEIEECNKKNWLKKGEVERDDLLSVLLFVRKGGAMINEESNHLMAVIIVTNSVVRQKRGNEIEG